MSLSQRKNFTKLWVMKYQNIKRRICTAVEYNTRICNCAFNILPFTFFDSNNCMDMHSVKILSTDQCLMGGHVTTERSDVSDVYMLLHTFNFCHGLMISSFYWIESISLGSITSCSTFYNLIFFCISEFLNTMCWDGLSCLTKPVQISLKRKIFTWNINYYNSLLVTNLFQTLTNLEKFLRKNVTNIEKCVRKKCLHFLMNFSCTTLKCKLVDYENQYLTQVITWVQGTEFF